ncbi:MAG TPA: alpha/beta fold hydrolase [Longimicrobiaceae bacterium]|nr:alpha/beta fold hydrolase [Longimicrobiaceae bacterium]
MRKATAGAAVLVLALAALPGGGRAQAPSSSGLPAGYWAGAFVRAGSAQPASAEFARDGDTLRVELAVPERVYLWPARVERDSLGRFRFPTPYGAARLALDTVSGEMAGPAGADSLGIRLHLKRSVRPHGAPPLTREEVVFRSGAVTLSGTLLRPAGVTRPAVAVVVYGRGCSRRSPYLGYGELLARHGTAALVFDKRGTGDSGGECPLATVQDLADDVSAAVRFLAGRRDVDTARIGALSWSAGGWVGALATRRAPLAFLAMHVGPATDVRAQQLGNMRAVLRRLGVRGADSAAAVRYVELMFAGGDRQARYDEMVRLAREGERTGWPGAFLDRGDFPRRPSEADSLWVRLHAYDPAPELRRFRAPLLALYGGDDEVVPPGDNVDLLRRLNPRARVQVVSGTGHDLALGGAMRALGTGSGAVTYWRFPRAAPEGVEALLAFLRENGMTGEPPGRR